MIRDIYMNRYLLEKRIDIWYLVFLGEMFYLRSRHLVLWLLETVTVQHRLI
jgi:hypothetical protein